uniref:Transcription termination factor 3, mitochondrial n=1 Tax=Ditylenchus dipsaci TaxID=166011 RepID=A0A915E204_9BILA
MSVNLLLRRCFATSRLHRAIHGSSIDDATDDFMTQPINRFRAIRYEEGELDKSNLSEPPSRENPHPFDPSTLPPTHSICISAYVNHLPVLQKLLDLGMDLLEVDTTTKIGRHLVRLDWEKDVQQKLHWLIKDVGVKLDDVGSYLTRNPFFLTQKLPDLKERVNYLKKKGFPRDAISKIVVKSRYWLNMDMKTIDARLGFVQRQFGLKGQQIRDMVIKEPRTIMFGLGPIQRLVIMLNTDFGFSKEHLRKILIDDPRLFLCELDSVKVTYHYLTRVMELSNEQIAEYPLVLRCSVAALRRRHEFLLRMKKAQYNQSLPQHTSLENLVHPSDRYFAEEVASSTIAYFNRFVKLL